MSTSTPSGGRSTGWAKVRRGARANRKSMYVQHSVHVQRPIKEVSEAVLESAPTWFLGMGDKKVARVGLHVAGVPVCSGP